MLIARPLLGLTLMPRRPQLVSLQDYNTLGLQFNWLDWYHSCASLATPSLKPALLISLALQAF